MEFDIKKFGMLVVPILIFLPVACLLNFANLKYANAKETKTQGNVQSIYSDILNHPELYSNYFAVTKNIPSDSKNFNVDWVSTQPYFYAIEDINRDGINELLLGQGLRYNDPAVLLNILQYDKEKNSIIDLDGERTYPLMDNLIFHDSGYYTTQNGVGGLYTECWYLKDKLDNYWFGYERNSDGFYDKYGNEITLREYYDMIGDGHIFVQWNEITEEKYNTANNIFTEEYILFESDKRVYTKEELNTLSKKRLRLAKNEISARHGRKFISKDLQLYFTAKKWYVPFYEPAEFNTQREQILNQYELENLKLLIELENQTRIN